MATTDEKAVAVLERAVQKKHATVAALELQLKEEREELEGMELALEQKKRRLGRGEAKRPSPDADPPRRDKAQARDAPSARVDDRDTPALRPHPSSSSMSKDSPRAAGREVSPFSDRKSLTPPARQVHSGAQEYPGSKESQKLPAGKRPRLEDEPAGPSQGSTNRDAPGGQQRPLRPANSSGPYPQSPQRSGSSASDQTALRQSSAGKASALPARGTIPPTQRPAPSPATKSAPQRTPAPQFPPFQAFDLISKIKNGSKSNPGQPRFQQPIYVQSQQKRRLRSLIYNPANPMECCVSSLDGSISFWLLQRTGKGLGPVGTVDANMGRRWPEDIAWSPDGKQVVAVYEADAKSTQLASIGKGRPCRAVDAKPHQKGVVHCINFLPWWTGSGGSMFATGGSDHAVVLWTEEASAPADFAWKPQLLHKAQHTAAVYGVAGMFERRVVLSAGADKRCVGMDAATFKPVMSHWLDSRCTGVFPNPKDPNLILAQTGSPGEQLSLIDFRASKTAVNRFGWQQSSTDQQTALISACWSSNGLFISSGTQDPTIQLFDIRQTDRKAFRVINCHEKRVFVARWNPILPVMVSISSDLNIAVHPLVV